MQTPEPIRSTNDKQDRERVEIYTLPKEGEEEEITWKQLLMWIELHEEGEGLADPASGARIATLRSEAESKEKRGRGETMVGGKGKEMRRRGRRQRRSGGRVNTSRGRST